MAESQVNLNSGDESEDEKEGVGSVLRLNEFSPQRKARFIAIAKDFWPNIGRICEAVGISRWTVFNHRKWDKEFDRALTEIGEQVCDDHELTLRIQGMTKSGFLDRMAYLRAHRPELYDRAKVVKIEGYKMSGGERTQRWGAVETVIDGEVVKSYTTRKERQRMKQGGAGGGGIGGPKPE